MVVLATIDYRISRGTGWTAEWSGWWPSEAPPGVANPASPVCGVPLQTAGPIAVIDGCPGDYGLPHGRQHRGGQRNEVSGGLPAPQVTAANRLQGAPANAASA